MRRLSSILALLLLLAACTPPALPVQNPQRAAPGVPLELTGVSLAADNGAYALWIDADNASFEIHGADGTVWRSMPEHASDSEWVDEMLQRNIRSPIVITVLDPNSNDSLHVLPSAGDASVRYESIPGGVRFVFRYDRQGITVPFDVTLNSDGFSASVAPGDVIESRDFLLTDIMVLPYFNSGSSEDDGFLFYPDGSGAVSDYQKNYNNAADVTMPVYGFDRGIGPIEVVSQAQGYRMPVFGAKTNGAAYLAVIEGAAAFISSVQTGVSRGNNRYFKNAAVFTYRAVGRVSLRESQTSVLTSYTIPSPVTATVPLTARYLLLTGGDVRYTDMAFAYRAYLGDTGVFTEPFAHSANSVHLTLTGALVKPSSFLGIPMEREMALTTFEQAGDILDALRGAGVDRMSVLFKGAQTGGFNAQWTRDFSFNRSLGGQKGFDRLSASYADDAFFLSGELMQIHKAGRGFSVSRDAARTTGNGVNFQNPYHLLDGTRDTNRRWYLLAPSLWADSFMGFAQSTHTADMAGYIAVEDAGELVYSEYSQTEPMFRDVTGPMLVDALQALKAEPNARRVALTYGNAYTWGIADTLYEAPLGASGYFIQSGEVPFYQLAVHGYIEYSGEPMNLSADKHRAFLRSVEYGALPHYSGIYAPSSDLNRSALEGIFSACYLDWLPDAANQTALAGDLTRLISGRRMTDHRQVADGVFRTSYENGVSVTVDYNAQTFSVSGGAGQ
ncbi:MAG: DUF5696 domain-containing protein [Oscillospiraceae bacterium]|nr:DUF5696 domain-containing protein [Oscillospiraceae bacterium]